MGMFSSLFKKKPGNTVDTKSDISPVSTPVVSSPTLHLRGKPDANGLYPSELVMLAVAERFNTTETDFPSYLKYSYEIVNPSKMLLSLQSKGLIGVGNAKDSLEFLKVAELKEIASVLGLPSKGKKAEIIAAISQVEEVNYAQLVKDRKWILTSAGSEALKLNPYIHYFLEPHPYSITSVGVDIWAVNEEFVKNPKRPFRDIIYRLLNDKMNEAALTFQKNPHSGSAYTHQYCECYRTMGLFVEEEGKSFVNASDLYFQYIYKRINIQAGLQLLLHYSINKNDKAALDEIFERYYDDIQLAPFHRTELLRIIDELGINGDAIREAFITSFKRANDTGVMSENEAADFVILELNGEVDQSRELALSLARKAVKKLGK